MKVEFKELVEYDAKFLHVRAGVRYWDDAKVNGQEDVDGSLIPFKKGDDWCPIIEIDTGKIQGWPEGVEADIHYKVCDDGDYTLFTNAKNQIIDISGYVPNCMCPNDEGYGDYIIMQVNGDGLIDGWNPSFEDFQETDED
jgi:hypothetical protein